MGDVIITANGDTTLHAVDVNAVWFQQDSATFNTSQATIDLFRQTLDDRLNR